MAAERGPDREFSAGVILVDKPTGTSSFAMVKKVRYLTAIKKVGHAGTLDPFASGLLVICIGRPATRMIDYFMAGEKQYIATLQLGVETSTMDPEGEVTATADQVPVFCSEELDRCLGSFKGPQMQAPPAYSAAKYKGKPLYHYARKGVIIKKEPKQIEIYSIERLSSTKSTLKIAVTCSRGTYIRVLASDIGRALGCGAHLTQLRRTRSGSFHVDDALSGEDLFDEVSGEQLLSSSMSIEEALKKAGMSAA